MSDSSIAKPSRRSFLGSAAFGIGTLAGMNITEFAQAAPGRTTDTVRLTWGLSGLNLIAKERGEFEKLLAKDGIKVEWLGPFPNHAPTLQAVTGGSADFSFGGSTTPALAASMEASTVMAACRDEPSPRGLGDRSGQDGAEGVGGTRPRGACR